MNWSYYCELIAFHFSIPKQAYNDQRRGAFWSSIIDPDNNIEFLKHFYEDHTEKLKYRDLTCLILKVLPWWICYYCFSSHIQLLVEFESVIVATTPYFEQTAPLTYALWSLAMMYN